MHITYIYIHTIYIYIYINAHYIYIYIYKCTLHIFTDMLYIHKSLLQLGLPYNQFFFTHIRGSLNKFPNFFRMGTFIDSTHMKL